MSFYGKALTIIFGGGGRNVVWSCSVYDELLKNLKLLCLRAELEEARRALSLRRWLVDPHHESFRRSLVDLSVQNCAIRLELYVLAGLLVLLQSRSLRGEGGRKQTLTPRVRLSVCAQDKHRVVTCADRVVESALEVAQA